MGNQLAKPDPQALSKLQQICKSTPIPQQQHSLRVHLADWGSDQIVSFICQNPHIVLTLANFIRSYSSNGFLINMVFMNERGVFAFRCTVKANQAVLGTTIIDHVMANTGYTWLGEALSRDNAYGQSRLLFVSRGHLSNDEAKQQPVAMQEGNTANKQKAPKEEDELPLPAGWSKAVTDDGKVYYKNDVSRTTQWEHPSLSKDKDKDKDKDNDTL